MAGIYIHIPFCKQACHYCDFHFSTSLRQKPRFLNALAIEMERRKEELTKSAISSIYFGGGTPSQLSASELQAIIDKLSTFIRLENDAEITLEANPDDLSEAYLKALRHTSVNRLSIGIQSFREEDLRWMNRAHNAQEAQQCISWAKDAGFDNLTIDLIYGFPQLPLEQWKENLERATALGIKHISSYCLTVEPGTALQHQVKSGSFPKIDDDLAAEHFNAMVEHLECNGYEHYEISNFAQPGAYAKHNTSYWLAQPYVGLGPSAHSFDGTNRRWNIANNRKYYEGLEQGQSFFELEYLTARDRFNERMLTGLRTQWGVDLNRLKADFSADFLAHFETSLNTAWMKPYLFQEGTQLKLNKSGRLFADKIASEFFMLQE